MSCSFCRITGQSRNLPKPHYPPLIPLPQHLDGGVSGCFLGANEKRIQFCKITSEVDYQHHHYNPTTSPSETELWARRGSGSPCRVMRKSHTMEMHHFTPSYQDLVNTSYIEGCRITQKNRSLRDYRYVYPCVLLGTEGINRSSSEIEDEVMREMQFSMSYMHHFTEGYEYVCPKFSSERERKDCLEELKRKLGVSGNFKTASPVTKEGHKYVYSVCDDLCSLVVPADIEELLRLGKVDNIWLTADRTEMVMELNRGGNEKKSLVTLSLATETLTSESLHEDLEGKNLLPGIAGGNHAKRLMEEKKCLKKSHKKKKLRSKSLISANSNVDVTEALKSSQNGCEVTNGKTDFLKTRISEDHIERPTTLLSNKLDTKSHTNGVLDLTTSARLSTVSPDLENSTSGHSSSNSSSCSSPCGSRGWPMTTILSPSSATTRCILIKGPDWEDIRRVAAENWLENSKLEEIEDEHIHIDNDTPEFINESQDTKHPSLTSVTSSSRTSFDSVEDPSTTSGGSDDTITETEILVSEIRVNGRSNVNNLFNALNENDHHTLNQQLVINEEPKDILQCNHTIENQNKVSPCLTELNLSNDSTEATDIKNINDITDSLPKSLTDLSRIHLHQNSCDSLTQNSIIPDSVTESIVEIGCQISTLKSELVEPKSDICYSNVSDSCVLITGNAIADNVSQSQSNSIENQSNVCINNIVLDVNDGGLTGNLTTTNEFSSSDVCEVLNCSSMQVVEQSTMNDCLTTVTAVTRSPRVRFRHPEKEEIPDTDTYDNNRSVFNDDKDNRICTTPKIGNVPVSVLTSEDNDDESDTEINDHNHSTSPSSIKHKDEYKTGINSEDDDDVTGIVSKILREHTAGITKSFRERYRLSSLEDDDDDEDSLHPRNTSNATKSSSLSHTDYLSKRQIDDDVDDYDDIGKSISKSSIDTKHLRVTEGSDDEDDGVSGKKKENEKQLVNGNKSEDPVKEMSIAIKMTGYTPALRLRDLIEQYVVVKAYTPKATDVGSIILREGQIVEVIDSESDSERWLVRTRPSKYLSPRQGWIPISYLEKKTTDDSYISILDDDYEIRSDSKEREAAHKRRNVVKEMVETEEEFVSDMQHVVHTYLREMDNPRMPKELRDIKDDIFLNFQQICDFHNNVLIKGVQYYAGEPTKLGKTFLRLERDFDMHAKYCQHEQQAQELLSELPVKEYFEEYSKRIGEVDRSLSDHLKLPIQRINDYQLLLKELIKYTARLKEDCTDLQKALDLMQGIPQRANDIKLTSNILGFKGNIHKLGRLLRHQDWFTITDSSGRSKERYLFLFKSRIFVTKVRKLSENKSSYILKDIIKLSDIDVIDTGAERQFEIQVKGETASVGNARFPLKLEAQSDEIKEAWFKELGDVKRDIDISEEGIIEDICEDRSSEDILEEEIAEPIVEVREEPIEKAVEPEVIEHPILVEEFVDKNLEKEPLQQINDEETLEIIEEETEELRPKVEILEDFQAYEELNTIMTDSIKSGSATPLDEFMSLASSHSEESSIYLTANEYEDGTSRPRFIKSLKGQTCLRGETVTLECEPHAIPPATVAWLKDNVTLTESGKIHFTTKGNLQYLVIKDTKNDDSGVYSCKATNKNGTASCSAQLHILGPEEIRSNPSTPEPKKPEFTIKFKDTELLEGTSVRFLVKIRANPDSEVKFFKNDKPLKEDNRIKITVEDKGTFELSIAHVTAADAGKYTCKAKNNLGESEFSAEVKVTDEKDVFRGLQESPVQNGGLTHPGESPDFKWFRDGVECEASERFKVLFQDEEDTLALVFQHVKPDDAGLYTCVASTSSGRISCSAELSVEGSVHQLLRDPEPPKITAELSDVEVGQGTSAMLELKVTGYPKPAITWTKDKSEIKPSNKHKILHEDDENMALIIKNISSDDAGKYTVTAKNALGEVASSANVIVKSPPVFRKTLSDAAVMAEQAIKFEVEIEGEPKPEITWYKDGHQLKDNERIKITESAKAHTYTLEIKKCRSEDAGNYSCVATNSSGKVSECAHATVNEAPKFLKDIKSIEVKESENIKFEVKVTGQPEPTVKWIKGDVEVKSDGKRIKIEKDDRNYTLSIDKVTRNDAEKYSCVISNDFGSVTGAGNLTVNSSPEYIEKLSDMTVKEGETDYKLKVRVSGHPSPKIRWFIESMEIDERSNKYKISDDGETKVLIIKKVESESSGNYSCTISNSSGEASCKGYLNVLTKPKFVETLSDLEKTEQEDVTLTVKVTGNPAPSLKWYKNSEEVSESATIKIYKVVDGTSKLDLKSLQEEAAGTYECHATNSEGEAVTVSKLIVNKKYEKVSEFVQEDIIKQERVNDETLEHQSINDEVELPSSVPESMASFIKKKHKLTKDNYFVEEVSHKSTSFVVETINGEQFLLKAEISTEEEIITVIDEGEPVIRKDVTYSAEESSKDYYSPLIITGDADVFIGVTLLTKKPLKDDDNSTALDIEHCNNDTTNTTEESCNIRKLKLETATPFAETEELDKMDETTTNKPSSCVIVDNDSVECKIIDEGKNYKVDKSEPRQLNDVNTRSGIEELNDLLGESLANPKFLGKMESVEVWSGQEAVLECHGKSIPPPEIKWFKNGEPLEDDKRIKIENVGDKHRVIISNTATEDSGTYKIELANKIGKAEIEGEIKVKASTEAIVPVLMKKLDNVVCVVGDNASYQAKIYSNPEPEIKWFKDGKLITPNDRYIIHNNNITHMFDLTVKNVTTDDIGKYTIVAENANGTVESEALMDVHVPPVIHEIKDKKAMPDSSVSFETKVTGKPKPSVKWIKGGEELKASEKVAFESDETKGTYKLTLKGLVPEDSGAYACVAENVAAAVKQPFNLSVTTEAPHFIKGLHNIGGKLNTELRADVQVYGLPMPSVKWFKNDVELSDNSNIKLIQVDERNFSLVIKKFTEDDTGDYTCKAINQAGEAVSHAKFTLHHGLPEFLKHLPKEVCVMDGEPVALEAKVDTNPMPAIKWLKDGKEIIPDEHVKTETLPDGTVKLTIGSAVPEDKGRYTLVAINDAGETPSSGQVVVEAMPKAPVFLKNLENQEVPVGSPLKLMAKITAYPKPTFKWLKDGKPVKLDGRIKLIQQNGNLGLEIEDAKPEDEGKYTLQVSNHRGDAASSCDVTTKAATTAPEILQPLKAVNAIEGAPCRLEAKVGGFPLPTCKWYKDGSPLIPDDNRIKSVIRPDGTVALLFNKCLPEDTGKYTLEAVNPNGSIKTDGDLNVSARDKSNEAKKAPSFTLPLRDVEVDEGKPFKLIAQIEGNPYPDISWTKDGEPLRMNDNVLMSCDGNKASLEIRKASPKDSGRYECKLSNPEGHANSHCGVNVKKIYSPPTFTQKPTDLFTIPGGNPRFVCRVGGIPKPDVTWFYNDRPLHDSSKYKIRRDGDLCALQITGANLDDKGRYKCLVSNDAGEDHAFANLDVSDTGDKKDKAEPPSFLKKLGDSSLMEGMTAKFTACVAGFPEPEYKWYLDGRELKDTDRIKIQVEPHGLLRLLIKNSKPEDVGSYTLKIWNPYGEVESTARLIFDQYEDKKPRKPKPDLNLDLETIPPHPKPDAGDRAKPKPHKTDDDKEPRDKMADMNIDYEKFRRYDIPFALPDKPIISKMTDRRLTLSWKPSIPRGPSVPVTYIVEMCEVPDGDWISSRSGIRGCCCEIRNLEPFRDYKFRVRVENKYGISDPSPFALTFRKRLEMSPAKQLPKLPPEFDFRPETSPYFPRDYDIDRPLHEEYSHAPRFLRQVDDVQYGVRGEPTTVEWYVYGYPTPTVEFTHDGQKIEVKDRYESAVARNGQCKLYITRMFDNDVGIYECIAKNEHGEARQRIHLDIAEHPVFIMPLEEESIMIRKSGSLQCRVVGKPYPEIKWYKDWHPLASSSRIKIEWKEPDLCTLTIDDVISKDGGLYSCCARNIAGVATSSAMVTIEEDENDYALLKYSHARVVRAKPKAMENFYDIGDELGRGTQGIVYHAVERSTGNSYAAKVMHGKGDTKKLMHQELDIMNQLHDRHLVRARDAFETKNALTIISDLAGGGELFDTICKQTTVTESEIAHFIRQILWGIDHMHGKGIAHLGLTPADILLSKPGGDDIKICDFGLARRILKGKDIYLEFGMPEFVAPEIVNHRPVGYPTDMWSVGVITYLLLSGISPFLGENDRETLRRIQTGQLTFDSDVFTNISDEAKDFISKLLVFDSEGRIDVKNALNHPWLRFADRPGSGNILSTDRLRNYYRRYRDWIRNSACDRFYRRRPLTYAFDHPSGMVYPPGEKYTPPSSVESSPTIAKPKPEFLPPKYTDHDNENEREDLNYELGYADSNSRYQNGPDTYLLQLRDVSFPLRLRQYMRVAGSASPSLGIRLQDTLEGRLVTVRERRRFTDVMDEEIDDEKKGQLDGVRRRISSEVSQRSETKNRIKELLPREEEKAPYFREKIRDTALTEGQQLEFSCLAIGEPKPVVTWYRNDVLMVESHRVKIVEEGGRFYLRFNTVKAFDAGFYKAVARNVAGEVTCRARLKQGELPGKADAPEASQISDTEALLTWHYPKADGNSPVICYCLEYKEADEPTWKEVRNNIDHQFFVVRNLTSSKRYSFRLRAQNQFGWGDYSNPLENVETSTPGAEKVSISCAMKHQQEMTENGQNSVNLDAASNKRPVTDYSVERNPISISSENATDKYRFISEISRGRFSVLVKCCSKEDSNQVFAAKLMEWSSSAEQEYAIAKSLRHEKIPTLFAAYHQGSMSILIMEKLHGCDVLTYLTRGKDYSEDTVAKIVAQVLDALEYLHFRRILHLDVQPDNVVVSDLSSARVKLVDFGTAQSATNYQPSRIEKKGNAEYLAPEVLSGEDVSMHADIWMLGVFTYILLSGVSPFKGETTKDTTSNVTYVRYRFEHLHKEITQESQRFLMAIFKRTPVKRPTADECLELKWLTPSEYMLKKREKAIFNSEPLKVFTDDYRKQKQMAATSSEGLMNAFGMQLSRSVSVEYQTMTTF